MPADPERNIEKELKAYAQQRRAARGAQPELHPATRKLLQDEAARLTKKEGRVERSPLWQLRRPWPRFAFVGFVALAVVAACMFFIPGWSNRKYESSRSQMQLAANSPVQKEQPARDLETLNGAPTAAKDVEEKKLAESPKKRSVALNATAEGKLSTAAVNKSENRMAPAPVATASAPLIAPPAPASPPGAKAFGPTAGYSLSGAQSPSPGEAASSAAEKKDFTLYFADIPVTPVIQPFRQEDLPQPTRKPSGGAGVSGVLTSFRVEQVLDKLVMVDSDGSVYAGFVIQTPETAKQSLPVLKKLTTQDSLTKNAEPEPQLQPARFYRFRVSGTNRTLNQEVIFTGNFLTSVGAQTSEKIQATNSPARSDVAPSGGAVLSLDLQKSRLEGRVLVGGSNQIEINATPVKP